MPEQVLKFQPDRTLYLRGFDGRGAAAALYDATPTSFKVSGVFRDPSDFAVLVLYDVDDFFGHPRLKYLPDFNLAGLVLEFDLHYAGLEPLDSPKFPTIDWPYLDATRADGTSAQIKLLSQATPVGAGPVAATGSFGFTFSGDTTSDFLTLWFENVSFTYQGGGTGNTQDIAAYLANQINAHGSGIGTYSLTATAASGVLTVTANPAGSDGNMIRMYAVTTNAAHLNVTTTPVHFSGGSSAVTWHVKLDFTALGIDSVRQMWLTFAPQLADSAAYASTNWDATFSNWAITADPNNVKALQVAGPGSVRVEESDVWAAFASSWASTSNGWFSKGFAQVSSALGDAVTVNYRCSSPHDLWLGTSVYSDRGKFSVSIDGGAAIFVDAYLNTGDPIATRRKIAGGLAPGAHTAVVTVSAKNAASSGNYCYFDFLEAVVPSAVPDAPGTWANRSPAIDYDTNHGYQLSPARLLWMFDKLGFTGPVNEYVGVFWWNQRTVVGQTLATATVTFGSGFVAGDSIFLDIGGTTIGKSVEAGESATVWAAHFAYFINETFSGVWASASGAVLTVTTRSSAAAYQFTFSTSVTSAAGTLTTAGALNNSVAGTWTVDPTQTPALNYGAQSWHADLFAQVKSRGNTIVSALSLELVDTPDAPPAHVWVCRFPDGSPVLTATGFGTLNSAQCVPNAAEFLAYQKAAFLALADLQAAAGLTPELQLGEFLWWFFPRLWLQPIGYVSYTNPISIGMPAAHRLATGDPARIGGVQGCTAANGLWPCTVTDSTHFTIPVAANAAWTPGTGTLSAGGMAYYDAATAAAATTALGRGLASFHLPTDDPSLNNYADANFLAGQLQAHAAAIVAYVQAAHANAIFELLFANDVNGAAPSTGPSQVGGPLNRYVSFPQQWRAQATAPFTRLKVEQLAFGSTDRNMDLVAAGLAAMRALAWPASALRYLYPIDNPGVAQWREYALAIQNGFATLTPFALDHVCLYGWPVAPPASGMAEVF